MSRGEVPRARTIPYGQGAIDLAIAAGAMLGTWWLASAGILPITKSVPELSAYLRALPPVLAVLLFLSLVFRLYRPRRAGSYGALFVDVLKVNLQAALVILALGFYYRGFSYSRVIVTAFIGANTLLSFAHHLAWMVWERRRYERGIGARACLIVGVGALARELAERIESHPWTGLSVVGFVDPGSPGAEGEPARVPLARVLGTVADLETLARERRVEEVIVAVPLGSLGVLPDLDAHLARSTIGLRWVPDLLALSTLSSEVAELDGLHIFDLRGVRTVGFGGALKRALDLLGSASLLLILSPLLALIALGIRVSGGRPVLFRQERMGLDGRVFRMLKFRTMAVDAEAATGPVWAQEEDPRVTRFGRWLRRSSLDELPQLWNVLVGEMSLVGPRPERPVFIEKFRHTVPNYMLRHRMKAGLTGWAQIHGWRGNTSLEERIQCDLWYAKHWSIWLDLKILLLTPLRGWGRNRNAY